MTCFQRCQEQEKYIWIYWGKGTFLFMRWWAFLLETTIAIILMRLEFLKLNVLNERHGLWSLLNHLRTDDVILKLFCTFCNLCLIDLLFSACTNLGGWQTFFPRTVWGGLKSRSVFSLCMSKQLRERLNGTERIVLDPPLIFRLHFLFSLVAFGEGGLGEDHRLMHR